MSTTFFALTLKALIGALIGDGLCRLDKDTFPQELCFRIYCSSRWLILLFCGIPTCGKIPLLAIFIKAFWGVLTNCKHGRKPGSVSIAKRSLFHQWSKTLMPISPKGNKTRWISQMCLGMLYLLPNLICFCQFLRHLKWLNILRLGHWK